MEIQIKTPDKQTPGFLKRAKQATQFAVRLKADPTPELFDEMVEFLLPYVSKPEDREEAKSALWNASQEQFENIMTAFSGGGRDGNVPPESATP